MLGKDSIDEAWVEAEMYSSVPMNQIINGNHYRRAMEAPEACVEQVSNVCVSKQGVREAHFSLIATLEKQLAEFDTTHAAHPMFQWAWM